MTRRRMSVIGATLALALAVQTPMPAGTPQSPGGAGRTMRVLHDLQYYTGPGADPRLHAFDLFLPEGRTNFPMLFFIHGGGWRGGDKVYAGLDKVVNICIDLGIGVMSVNYRLSPAVKHPTHIQDVARAFAWLYNNGKQYGADPTRIFVAGGSAGGHLAALLGLDPRYLAEHGLSPKIIKGVMPFSGAYDMAHLFTVGSSSGVVASQTPSTSGNNAEGGLYEMVKTGFGTEFATLRDASPVTFVGKLGADTPPYLIAYTEDDMFGFDEQALQLYSRFVRNRLKVELVQQPGRIHSTKTSGIGVRMNGADDVLGPAIKRFMTSILGGTYGETQSAVWPPQGSKPPAIETHRDLKYADGAAADPARNLLDLYVPAGKQNVPMLFYVHGGGWTGGSKNIREGWVNLFGRLGMAVASIDYRVSPAVKHPTHIQDVARAFAWLYKNAATYRIDRDRIVIAGSSAGSHLVSLLGLNTKHLADQGVPAGAVKGVVAISGIYELATFPEPGIVPTRKEQAFGTDLSVWKEASPQTYVSAKAPPILITFTNWDIFMLREQALEFYNRLLRVGAQVELVHVPGRNHSYDPGPGDPVTSRYIVEDVLGPHMARFVYERVKTTRATTSTAAP